MSLFAPDKQAIYCKAEQRCIEGTAPSISETSEAYGTEVSLSWLEIQIKDLSDFSGCKEKLEIGQIKEIARILAFQFGAMKITEMMLFFYLFKCGQFGKFYGAVDGLTITTAFNEFIDYRFEKKFRYEEERRKIEQKEREEHDKYFLLTRSEYEEYGWLYNIGYEPRYYSSIKELDDMIINIQLHIKKGLTFKF